MIFKLGDRVRLCEGARDNVVWGRNKYRHGTVVRLYPNEPWQPMELAVLWDGKESLEDWWEQALEKIPCT